MLGISFPFVEKHVEVKSCCPIEIRIEGTDGSEWASWQPQRVSIEQQPHLLPSLPLFLLLLLDLASLLLSTCLCHLIYFALFLSLYNSLSFNCQNASITQKIDGSKLPIWAIFTGQEVPAA